MVCLGLLIVLLPNVDCFSLLIATTQTCRKLAQGNPDSMSLIPLLSLIPPDFLDIWPKYPSVLALHKVLMPIRERKDVDWSLGVGSREGLYSTLREIEGSLKVSDAGNLSIFYFLS
jgi:hypothetical protein